MARIRSVRLRVRTDAARFNLSCYDPASKLLVKNKAWVTQERLTHSGAQDHYNLVHVVERQNVLAHPYAVFRGLKRLNMDKAMCFVGAARFAFPGGVCCSKPDDFVFAAFLYEDFEVFGWHWIHCDQDNPHLPEDHKNRFDWRIL